MTTESDLPEEGTATDTIDAPMSFADGVSGIADLIEDPETDLQESAEAESAEQPEDDADDFTLEAEEDGEPEDVDEEADDQSDDGSEDVEYAGGRFAADNAKVKLDDGTTITVGELRRNNLFQRDYTKKTTELKAERDAFEAEKSSLSQYAQQLDQFREYGEWLVSHLGIQDPGPYKGLANDPVAYLQHMQAKEQYEAIVNGFQQFKAAQEQTSAKTKEQASKEAQDLVQREIQALHTKLPALKDPAKNKAFWSRLEQGAAEHYGIPAELVQSIGDHRMALVLHDALEGRRLRQAAPKVKEQVQGKPKIVTGSKRPNPQATQGRDKQVRAERLRKTGDFRAGVASLMDFDL